MGIDVKVKDRIKNFEEFHGKISLKKQQEQAVRCMACGVPFCQNGQLVGTMYSGCPLNNLVPETNNLVSTGNWEQAYERLVKTNPLPEFTSRVCPALCEHACTHNLYEPPVETKENERAIIENAYAKGYIKSAPPAVRTGKKVAVVGSGPSGLATALMLNKRGHSVTVYERSDRIGGLLRYGIPNMKLDKKVIDRRVELMKADGIEFRTGVNVGVDIKAAKLKKEYDAVVLCCGASNPRNINAPGRDADGIYFAVTYLSSVTKNLLDSAEKNSTDSSKKSTENNSGLITAKDKNVVVIGGGDTGNDCVGTAIRQGAKSVVQLEMMPKPPEDRTENNPWPEWPKVLKTDYGQQEAIEVFGKDPRLYKTTVKEFVKDKNGKLKKIIIVSLESKKDEKTGRMQMVPIEGTEKELPAELVLIAAGFLGSESYVTEDFKVETDARTNVATTDYETTSAGIFAAGDMRRGQSLVVWAIREGKNAAKAVDMKLMGYTGL